MAAIRDFIVNNALLLVFSLAALVILLIALGIAVYVKRTNRWREKEFAANRDAEMLRVRVSELEKETAQLHEHEAQILSERDAILMAAHEKADDILEQTMERVQKSEAQIRQNRIIASCCITDARRRVSDLMIEMSRRLVIEDGNMLGAEHITPEEVEAAEKEEQSAERETGAASEETGAQEPTGDASGEAKQPVEEADAPAKEAGEAGASGNEAADDAGNESAASAQSV